MNKDSLTLINQIILKGFLDEPDYKMIFRSANNEFLFRTLININDLMEEIGVEKFIEAMENEKIKVSLKFEIDND